VADKPSEQDAARLPTPVAILLRRWWAPSTWPVLRQCTSAPCSLAYQPPVVPFSRSKRATNNQPTLLFSPFVLVHLLHLHPDRKPVSFLLAFVISVMFVRFCDGSSCLKAPLQLARCTQGRTQEGKCSRLEIRIDLLLRGRYTLPFPSQFSQP
jgi:hypothetical protein